MGDVSVTFNQTVKHGTNVYQEGETRFVTDGEAEYFGDHGWLEGVAPRKSPEQIQVPDTRSLDIVPENPYVNDTPLEVHNGTLGTGDTNG